MANGYGILRCCVCWTPPAGCFLPGQPLRAELLGQPQPASTGEAQPGSTEAALSMITCLLTGHWLNRPVCSHACKSASYGVVSASAYGTVVFPSNSACALDAAYNVHVVRCGGPCSVPRHQRQLIGCHNNAAVRCSPSCTALPHAITHSTLCWKNQNNKNKLPLCAVNCSRLPASCC